MVIYVRKIYTRRIVEYKEQYGKGERTDIKDHISPNDSFFYLFIRHVLSPAQSI